MIVSGRAGGDALMPVRTWRIDADGSNLTRLTIAETDQAVDWSSTAKRSTIHSFESRQEIKDGRENDVLDNLPRRAFRTPTAKAIRLSFRSIPMFESVDVIDWR